MRTRLTKSRRDGQTVAPAIEARGLRKEYGRVVAVKSLRFEVAPGDVYALLGPNGAGKSTTIRMLATLTTPTAGDARVGGRSVVEDPLGVRRVLGYVSQRSGPDPNATGRENLVLQGRVFGLRGRALSRRVDALLERFGLEGAADRLVRTYSGGMVRRLDLALGLVQGPSVLLLDEPTAGLDPQGRADLWQEIRSPVSSGNLTVLLTTHYMDEADALADRVGIMNAGEMVVEGTPSELKAQLKGDALQIDLAAGEADVLPRARQVLTTLDGVSAVTIDGGVMRARADSGAAVAPRAVAALEAAGVPVATLTISRPSLQEVFLVHTGRPFEVVHGQRGGA